MIRVQHLMAIASALVLTVSSASAAKISGEYLEARTCDVYTGPCFANAEMGLAGKQALMAWKIEKGGWNNVSLHGMNAALVVSAENTLGFDGVFPMKPGKVQSVILVDDKASPRAKRSPDRICQRFRQETHRECQTRRKRFPCPLKNNHLDGRGVFSAGRLAKIETRGMKKSDCVCSNEVVYYQPLTKVKNFHPAYLKTLSYHGEGLNNKWTTRHIRSAFLATFRK